MGEQERCPKCNSALRYEHSGYTMSKVINGGVIPLNSSYNCWCCGYYKDIDPTDVAEITEEMKNITNYPKARRAIGEPGWLQQIVTEEMPRITRLKARNWSWTRIYEDLTLKYPEIAHCGKGSVGNVWRRLERKS